MWSQNASGPAHPPHARLQHPPVQGRLLAASSFEHARTRYPAEKAGLERGHAKCSAAAATEVAMASSRLLHASVLLVFGCSESGGAGGAAGSSGTGGVGDGSGGESDGPAVFRRQPLVKRERRAALVKPELPDPLEERMLGACKVWFHAVSRNHVLMGRRHPPEREPRDLPGLYWRPAHRYPA